MPAYLYLALAIGSEVVGTLALRSTRGFTTLVPSVIVIVSYVFAFYMLSLTLRTVPVGIAYAIWSGVGTAVIAVAGLVLFQEKLSTVAFVGIGLIVVGVILLELGSTSTTAA